MDPGITPARGFAYERSLREERKSNNPPRILSSVTPSRPIGSHGILTMWPSTAAFAIALGPTYPWMIDIAKETLGLRRSGLSPDVRLLVPTFSLPNAPVALAGRPSLRWKCSPTTRGLHRGDDAVLCRRLDVNVPCSRAPSGTGRFLNPPQVFRPGVDACTARLNFSSMKSTNP